MKNRAKKLWLLGCACLATTAIGATIGVVAEQAKTTSGKIDYQYAPDIIIDWEGYAEESVPVALKNVPYRVFSAHAEDVYGEQLTVSKKVFLHYNESTKSIIQLENDAIIPKYFGIYTVEYTAMDEFGNVSVATYDFECAEKEKLSMEYMDGATTALAGYETEIADVVCQNENGNVMVQATATLKGGEVVYDLTGKTSFKPAYAGEYTVAFVCSDYTTTVTDSYTLTVSAHSNALFAEEVNLPSYFIVGKEYTLAVPKGYQYVTGKPIPITPTLAVKEGKNKVVALNNATFTASQAGDVELIYRLGENVQTYKAKAVDVGYGDFEKFDIGKYFYSDSAKISVNTNAGTATTEVEGARVEFINDLNSCGFDFGFNIPDNGANFGKLNFYLTDSMDKSVVVKVSLRKISETTSVVSINDGVESKFDYSFYSAASLNLQYDEKTNTIAFGSDFKLNLENFNGFPSGKLEFAFEFEDVEGVSKVGLNSVNNQAIYAIQADIIAPQVWFEAYDGGLKSVGDLITVAGIAVGDVLDPDYTVSYCIKRPNGEYAIDENGLVLSAQNTDHTKTYTFRAVEYGYYTVEISAKDFVGNTAGFEYTINVDDTEAPVATLQEEMPTEIKAGEAFTISALDVLDNITKECSVDVNLMTPFMLTVKVEMGKTYSFATKGTYCISYTVKDAKGNTTIITHSFKVV